MQGKNKAALAQLGIEWKKAYGTDKNNTSGFGMIVAKASAKITGKEMLVSGPPHQTSALQH